MRNIKLTIAYDGTNYSGWQRQINAVGIEQKVEMAVNQIFNKKIKIIGCSRTDKGVHALGQVALMQIDSSIEARRIPGALNSKLPVDIVVTEAIEVTDDFHPRYSVKNKTYEYNIYNDRYINPQLRLYYLHILNKLDVNSMKKTCKYFEGTHDFKGFCSIKTAAKSTIRTINNLTVTSDDNLIKVTVNGDGFLYNMVRIIVGTLIDVGRGKIKPEQIEEIIQSKERTKAGKTALAKGLVLKKINY